MWKERRFCTSGVGIACADTRYLGFYISLFENKGVPIFENKSV